MRANFIALDSRVDGGASISWKLLNTFRMLSVRLLWLVFALLGNQSEWYCILNAIPEYSAIQKCSTRAQTSVHSQAHSGNCAIAPKKLHWILTQQKLSTPSEYRSTDWVVAQVGWVKNRFRHHRTGRNDHRLKHDAILERHYTTPAHL